MAHKKLMKVLALNLVLFFGIGASLKADDFVDTEKTVESYMEKFRDGSAFSNKVLIVKELIKYLDGQMFNLDNEEKLFDSQKNDLVWGLLSCLSNISFDSFDRKQCPKYRESILSKFKDEKVINIKEEHLPVEALLALEILDGLCQELKDE